MQFAGLSQGVRKEKIMVETIRLFKGSSNIYAEIAQRKNEVLGLHLEYRTHPANGVGFLLVRFVAYSKDGEKMKFTHFAAREKTTFVLPSDNLRKGMRLNRVPIPLFTPGVTRFDVGVLGDEAGIWPIIGSWITEQVKAEGFDLIVDDMSAYVRSQFTNTTEGKPELILEFPDLTSAPQEKTDEEIENDD
jgi:hypothetical protein